MKIVNTDESVATLERELENSELRILESIWCLERSVLDQLEMLKAVRGDLRNIKLILDLEQLKNLDR